MLALSDRGYPSSAVSFLADASAKPAGKDAAAAGAVLAAFGLFTTPDPCLLKGTRIQLIGLSS
ncbi:MAG: hypothetical protein OEY56_12275 [Cyclobacteriaceae bacterium]|nr:hypothetical protein [Cyclobacteriaceae bacterium]